MGRSEFNQSLGNGFGLKPQGIIGGGHYLVMGLGKCLQAGMGEMMGHSRSLGRLKHHQGHCQGGPVEQRLTLREFRAAAAETTVGLLPEHGRGAGDAGVTAAASPLL